ncbi:hypothetical protein NFI96_001226 [Prochilodus magdalenae]|nr:hypothetical protein NFI96_001226 [Prochilodus magdalenae]
MLRNPVDDHPSQSWAGQKEAGRYPTPIPSYGGNRDPYGNQPGSPRLPVPRSEGQGGQYPLPPPAQRGPLRQDVPPSPTPVMRAAPRYETVAKGGYSTASPDEYGAYGDGQYPDPRQKKPMKSGIAILLLCQDAT